MLKKCGATAHTYLDAVDAVLVRRARALQQLRVQLPVGCEELKPHRLLVPADEKVHRWSRKIPQHLWMGGHGINPQGGTAVLYKKLL